MAVVTECFSIREYTERMRSVNLQRCWPFGVRTEDALSLPSISVRRFKWWTDEVDAGRSDEGVVEEDNLEKQSAELEISKGDGIPAPERNAVEVSAALPEGEDARRLVKGKQKTPKKRSIVELFAAVPLIAGAVDDVEEESGDEDSREEVGGGGRRDTVQAEEREVDVAKRKKNVIMETDIKKKRGRKKRKRKKGITGLKLEIRALEKKKTRKVKTVRKHKVLQTSKPFSMKKEAAKKLPVRSILKSQKKSSKQVSTRAANLIKLYCESNKHVTFSVKDDILGSGRASSTMDFPQMQNLCKIFSDVLAATSAINNSSKGYDPAIASDKPQDVNSCENDAHKTEASSSECKNQSTIINSSNSSCSGTEKASYAVMVDLNRAIEANDFDNFIPATSTLSSSCTCLADPSRGIPREKNQNSASEVLLKAGLPSPSESLLVSAPHDHFVMSSDAISTPVFKENERRCQPHVNAGVNFYSQIEGHQSTHGLLSGSCYSVGSKKFGESLLAPDSVSTCKSQCSGEDFIGLPLNSHGELIQFHSGTKFNEPYKKQNLNLGSNGRKKHSEIAKKKVIGAASFQKNYYSTKERVRHWLNFAELDGSNRLGIQRNEPTMSNERFLHRNSDQKIHDFRNGSDLQPNCNFDHHPQPAVQPTMRLMGKNVVLGGISSDLHTFNVPRTSKKNKTFVGQTRFSMFPEKSPPQPWIQRESVPHATIGRSKGSPFQVADATPKFYSTESLDPSFNYMHTHQPLWLPRSCENHIFRGDMEKQVLPSQAFSNNYAQSLGNCISGEGSIRSEHRYPAVAPPHPQMIHQNVLTSSSYCHHDRRLFHGELSRTKPQFKYQDLGKFSQPPENLPQWLLSAKEQKRNQISDSHYSHLVQKNSSVKKKDMYPNFACFEAPVDSRKLGKRSSEFDGGITNPAKRPLKAKEASMNFQQTASGNGVYGSVAGSSSSRFDNESRSGPIKLIGGAKHILKPCQAIDDEPCRPIHSTIIFPGTASSFGAEKKLANIYKF